MTVATEQTPEEVSPVVTGDISEVTEKLEELKEVLSEEKEPTTVNVDGKEMTQEEVMAEILTTLQPDPEQVEKSNTDTQTEIQLQKEMVDGFSQMMVATEEQQAMMLEQNELQLQQHKEIVEGFYFVGLSIVISFAIYMFWNQLSKW